MASGFVDEVVITVHAGDGGDGVASFQREKYRPKGGPNGGDGGHGGSVALVAEEGMGTLVAYRGRAVHRAKAGAPGGPNTRRGADADDLTLPVPVGTVVCDEGTGEVLADLAKPGASFVVAKGGRGGRGNASLRSEVDRNPTYAERGDPGQEAKVRLELRLVADVGLLGPPNAGKSTLLSAVSRARPKVADYPFTTIDPSLGVVETDADRIVVADLPGLIEGAAEGRGLGLRFLRHAERCGVLAAVVDASAVDPVSDLEAVVTEAGSYDPPLDGRVTVVVANKLDLGADLAPLEGWATAHGARCVAISALEGNGIDELVGVLVEEVRKAEEERGAPESFAVFRPVTPDRIEVRREDDGFRVSSDRVERLVRQTPLGNPRAVRRLQRRLKALGVENLLAEKGAQEGDDVYIGDETFTFLPEEDAT